MKPLEQHNPPGMSHPLVEPWAKAQETPTALVYQAAAYVSASQDRDWQKPARDAASQAKGVVLLSDRDARHKARLGGRRLMAARVAVRETTQALAKLKLEVAKEGQSEERTARREALTAEREAAQAIVNKPRITSTRTQRRAAWREVRKGRAVADWRGIWSQVVTQFREGRA